MTLGTTALGTIPLGTEATAGAPPAPRKELYIGTNQITAAYVSSNALTKIYIGANEIYSST